MTTPYQAFGLSCPRGGTFYICQGTTVEFIGCCTTDPCGDGSGACPAGNLRPATFSGDTYDDLPTQDCNDSRSSSAWYTCKFTTPPFVGCCASNACQNPHCPTADLLPAKLSGDRVNRAKFLTPSLSGSSPAPPPPTGTGTPVPNVAATPQPEATMSTGAIAGIAVSVGLLVVVIIGILMYKFGWRAHKRKVRDSAALPPPSTGPEYSETPYYDSQPNPFRGEFRDSYTSSATAVVSPRNTLGYGKHMQHGGYSLDMFAQPFPGTPMSMDPRHPSPAYSAHARSHSGGGGVPAALPAVYEIDSREAANELASDHAAQLCVPYVSLTDAERSTSAPQQKQQAPPQQNPATPQPSQMMPMRNRPSFESAFPSPHNPPTGASVVSGGSDSQFASPLGSPRYPLQNGEYAAVPLQDEDAGRLPR